MEPPHYRRCFDTTGLPESMCETFTDLNDTTRGEPMHKIFMDKVPDDTNQGTPSQGDSCSFPFFKNVGVPLMATLYIPGLNVGLLVWLGTIPNVPNALDASQLSTLIHGHPIDVSSLAKSSPPPSPAFCESTVTSNQKSKRNRKRNNRKKKSPTSKSHVGDRSTTSASHVEDQHPTSASYVGGTHPPSASHAGGKSPVTASHAGGIDSIEKPRWTGCKPKFSYKICKGYHLTHVCPGIPGVQRLWSLSARSCDSYSSEVSS
jgi:hypothetical protein